MVWWRTLTDNTVQFDLTVFDFADTTVDVFFSGLVTLPLQCLSQLKFVETPIPR